MPVRDVFVVGDRQGENIYGTAIKEIFPNPDNLEAPSTWEIDPATGRIALISGVDCYIQGLRIGLRTHLGSRPLSPDAGTILDELVGSNGSRTTAGFLRAEVMRFLMTDPRTDEVIDVQVGLNGDAFEITCQARPVKSSQPISFTHVVTQGA